MGVYPDWNDLKPGTIAVLVLDDVSQPAEFGNKRARVSVRVMVRESAPICISRECTCLHFPV